MTTTQTKIPERGTAAFRKYAAEVMLSDGPWEIKWKEPHWNKSWQKQDEPSWDWSQFDYRIAPQKPKVVPWTFETAPIERLRVCRKRDGKLFAAETRPDEVFLAGSSGGLQCGCKYEDFARDFEQLDGSPCGVKVENEEWPQWYRNRSGDAVWRMDSDSKGEFFERCGGIDSASMSLSPMSLSQLKAHASMTRITAAEAAELLKGVQA